MSRARATTPAFGWVQSTATRESGPRSHQYVAYAACWEAIPDDGLPRYDEARPGYAAGR